MRKKLLSILLIPFICACGVKTVNITERELINHIKTVVPRHFMLASREDYDQYFNYSPYLPEKMNFRAYDNLHYVNLNDNSCVSITDYSYNKKEKWLCGRRVSPDASPFYWYYHDKNGKILKEEMFEDGSYYDSYESLEEINHYTNMISLYISGTYIGDFFPTIDSVIGKNYFIESSRKGELYSAKYHAFVETRDGLIRPGSVRDTYSDGCGEFFINFDIGNHYVSNCEITYKYKDIEGIYNKSESLEFDNSLHSKVVELFSNR